MSSAEDTEEPLLDVEGSVHDVESAVQDVEAAVRDVEEAVNRVEEAVANKWSTFSYLVAVTLGVVLFSWLGDLWHAKWRYAASYGVSSEKVFIDDRPHDCAFLAAPLGEKYCRYERAVSTIRWATSTSGEPIVSYDEGKTWSAFTPPATVTVPRYSTVEEVHISWKRIAE
jgi:hypothetical protein